MQLSKVAAAPQKHPAGGTGPGDTTAAGPAGQAAAHPHLTPRAKQQGQEPGRPPAASLGAGRGHRAGTRSGDTTTPCPPPPSCSCCCTAARVRPWGRQPPASAARAGCSSGSSAPLLSLPTLHPFVLPSLPAPNPPARPYRSGPAGQRRLQAAAPRNQSGRQEAPGPARPRSEPAEPGAGPPVRPRGRERGLAAPGGGLKGEGASWVVCPGPCPSRDSQGRVPSGFEHLQRRRLHSPCGQPVLSHPHNEVLPHTVMKPPVVQFLAINPHPITEKFDPILFALSPQVEIEVGEIPSLG